MHKYRICESVHTYTSLVDILKNAVYLFPCSRLQNFSLAMHSKFENTFSYHGKIEYQIFRWYSKTLWNKQRKRKIKRIYRKYFNFAVRLSTWAKRAKEFRHPARIFRLPLSYTGFWFNIFFMLLSWCICIYAYSTFRVFE